jgi:hypothetical protein
MPSFADMGAPGGNYMKSADVPAQGITLVITGGRVDRMKDRDGHDEVKPVLLLRDLSGREAPSIVLNVTNRSTLEQALGQDVDRWIGQQVNVRSEPVRGPSGMTTGIRIYPVQAAAAPQYPQQPAAHSWSPPQAAAPAPASAPVHGWDHQQLAGEPPR